MAFWLAELAWTGSGLQRRLLLEERGGRWASIRTLGGDPVPEGARALAGLCLPGLSNAHSHAFHRALRGCCEDRQPGDFWSWRLQMLEIAGRLAPETYHLLARAVFAEMVLAGITSVGEFHYLHHQTNRVAYRDGEMERALIDAAAEAGIRLTLIDACYLWGGMGGEPLVGPAMRFGDTDAQAWRRRVERLPERPGVRIAAAIHSVRAVDAEAMRAVRAWADAREAPLHFHLSEQPAENEVCLRATGLTPTALLDKVGALGPRSTAVHAIHLSDDDLRRLGGSGTAVCVCPTTERQLGDGVCRAEELEHAGSPLCLGTDSNAVTDLFEEARAVELDQRLVRGVRGIHQPESLLQAATRGGAFSLGWDGGELRVGALADLVSLDLQSPRLAGPEDEHLVARVVFAASAADVRDVLVGGREVVRNGRHQALGDVGWHLEQALERVVAGARP